MEKVITIPKDLIREKELVLIPRKKYDELLEGNKVTEEDILRWTKEARTLKRIGKLPEVKSWVGLKK